MAINRSNENSEILKQMKDMSEVLLLINSQKQIILIDTLEKLQKSSTDQINIIMNRLSKLENFVYNVMMNNKNNYLGFNVSRYKI